MMTSNIHSALRGFAVPMDSIVLDPYNARSHDDRNLGVIQRSLEKFGQRVLLTVTPDGVISKGNGTWLAAKRLGWTEIAVLETEDDPLTATQWAVMDNRSAELSEWDRGQLLEQLQEIEAEVGLEATGFREEEFETLMAFVAFEAGDDEAAERILESREQASDDASMKILSSFQTEYVATSELRPHERKYYDHPHDQILHLVKNIEEHGFYQSVVIARDGTILVGYDIVEAVHRMGLERIPVRRLDIDPNSSQALKLLVGDKEIKHLDHRDDRMLSKLLKDIKEQDASGLVGTGYDDMMLAGLAFVTRTEDELVDFDAAAHWVGMPEYEPPDKIVSLTVRFKTLEDRTSFVSMLELDDVGITKFAGGMTWSMWWPPREDEDLVSLRFEETEKQE
jgi:ParB-like chromosome segregation protein Spo0J